MAGELLPQFGRHPFVCKGAGKRVTQGMEAQGRQRPAFLAPPRPKLAGINARLFHDAFEGDRQPAPAGAGFVTQRQEHRRVGLARRRRREQVAFKLAILTQDEAIPPRQAKIIAEALMDC